MAPGRHHGDILVDVAYGQDRTAPSTLLLLLILLATESIREPAAQITHERLSVSREKGKIMTKLTLVTCTRLAMYYNGYIIICIFIGAYLGSFIFQWETLGSG